MSTCPVNEFSLEQFTSTFEASGILFQEAFPSNLDVDRIRKFLEFFNLDNTIRENVDSYYLFLSSTHGVLVEFSKGCGKAWYGFDSVITKLFMVFMGQGI